MKDCAESVLIIVTPPTKGDEEIKEYKQEQIADDLDQLYLLPRRRIEGTKVSRRFPFRKSISKHIKCSLVSPEYNVYRSTSIDQEY